MPLNRVNPALPETPFLLNDLGDLIGYLSKTGRVVFIPASASDNGLTATAGGGQANGLQLNYRKSRVTTVATIADSVKLPKAEAGMEMTVINAGANSMNVFPATGQSINALAANTAIAVAANSSMTFHCAVDGTWNTIS